LANPRSERWPVAPGKEFRPRAVGGCCGHSPTWPPWRKETQGLQGGAAACTGTDDRRRHQNGGRRCSKLLYDGRRPNIEASREPSRPAPSVPCRPFFIHGLTGGIPVPPPLGLTA
jgi:hypothetical protein